MRPSGRRCAAAAVRDPSRSRAGPLAATSGPAPGDLDWTTLARFAEPGHALTGDRTSSAAKKRRKLGYDVVHAIVDDHSRLAYAEVLRDAKAATVTSFCERRSSSSPRTGSERSGS